MIYGIVFAAALITAVFLIPVTKKISFRYGMVAEPGGRRQHSGRIPKLGGIPLFLGYLVGIILIYKLLPPGDPHDALRLRGVVLGTAVLFLGGLLDDRYNLSPCWQFFFQFLGAAVAINHIIFIERFTNPLPNPAFWSWGPLSWFFSYQATGNLVIIWRPLVFVITLFWVLGMINAVNWLDGLDGLAAGVGTIAVLLFAWHGHNLGQTTVPLFSLALAGALIGFLIFNFSPASIFLGTAGAWVLGYNLATLSILSPAKLSTALLVLAIPILDVAWLIFHRLWHRQSPLQGDRKHLHFRLLDRGLPTRLIVLGYYLMALGFGMIAILAQNRIMKIGIWLALIMVILILLIKLNSHPPQIQTDVSSPEQAP
ncbi:MAG: undecaprenyl/decaprenyl-phosphate alpha-N-acetylglucosaminyl 1-phosphate transferase [Chloroflexi bacterium]|nr:undecaprenyl/decaprenyl-phosphate alpha-N-acetylglucosaminyl 1-phosphate transferase [Chloroflexota bacterium]